MNRKVREYLASALYFAVLAMALVWRQLLNRLSLVPVQASYRIDNLFGAQATTILDKYPNNSLLFDVTFQFFPWSAYALERVQNWDIPLWNPFSLAGLPFIANHQSSVFELTKLAAYALNLEAVWLPTFSWWLTTMLAGFFTYAFLRSLDLSVIAALVGGTAFALCGPMVVWLGWPHSSTAIWLPFLLLCAEKIIATRRAHWVGSLAAGAAFVIYAGHIQIAFFVVFATALWSLFRLVDQYRASRDIKWPIIGLAIAGFLGLGLASIQLWPTLEFVRQSVLSSGGRSLTGGMSVWQALRTGAWLDPHGFMGFRDAFLNLGLWVYPDLFGNTEMAYFRPAGNYNENSVYVGVGAGVFALIALFNRRHRGPMVFFTLLAIISMGAALALPGLALLNYLPGFNFANMGRIRYLASFSLAVLAAVGVDTIFRETDGRKRRTALLLAAVLLAASIAAVFGFVRFSAHHGYQVPSPDMITRELTLLAGLVAIAALIAALSGSSRRSAGLIARGLLVSLVAFELLSYGIPLRGGIDPALVKPNTPALSWLKENAGFDRVTSYRETADNRTSLYPNSSVLEGLYDIRGYEVVKVKRFEQLQRVVAGQDSRMSYRKYRSDFFDISGVAYFIQSTADSERALLERQGLTVAYQDADTVIYENRSALPRVFVAHITHTVKDEDVAVDWFRKEKVDFRRAAIVEDGPRLEGRSQLSPAKIVEYSPEANEISADAQEKGMLVLSDAYYPGWKAFVDGKETRIYPVNVAFRGVVISKGEHRVRFVYQPDSYRRALFVFFPSFALMLGLLAFPVVTHYRSRSGE